MAGKAGGGQGTRIGGEPSNGKYGKRVGKGKGRIAQEVGVCALLSKSCSPQWRWLDWQQGVHRWISKRRRVCQSGTSWSGTTNEIVAAMKRYDCRLSIDNAVPYACTFFL